MKIVGMILAGSLVAAPVWAQSDRLYVEGTGGFAVSSDTSSASVTSGHMSAQVGARVWNHLSAFGELGRFRDLQPTSLESAVDNTVSTLASNSADVVGASRMPATYGLGGARLSLPTKAHVTPYMLGGIGAAHLTPSAEFTFTDGTLPGMDPAGSLPVGEDVTGAIVSTGAFTQPPASTNFMFQLGGGADLAMSHHWGLDVGYRYSRVSATEPLNAQGMSIGVGYRF